MTFLLGFLAEGVTLETPYLIGVFVGAGGVIAFLFRLLVTSMSRELAAEKERFAMILAAKDATQRETVEQKKIYQEVASEAIRSAAETTNFYRQREGKPPLLLPVPVIPEGSSPSTARQLEQAQAASMRAAMVTIKAAVGQEPRKEPGHGTDFMPAKKDAKTTTEAAKTEAVAAAIVEVSKPILEAVKETGEDTNRRVRDLKEEQINKDPDTVNVPRPPEGWTK